MRPCSSWETSIEAASSRRSLGRWSSSSLTSVRASPDSSSTNSAATFACSTRASASSRSGQACRGSASCPTSPSSASPTKTRWHSTTVEVARAPAKGSSRSPSCASRAYPTTMTSSLSSTNPASSCGSSSGRRISSAPISSSCPAPRRPAPISRGCARAVWPGAIVARAASGGRVLGVCGGCQMLGRTIEDPDGVESDLRSAEGLALLPLRVRFGRDKRTAQVRARAAEVHWLSSDGDVLGYEIHMGLVERLGGARGAFALRERNGAPVDDVDGAVSPDGCVVGTMIHGLFENPHVRRALLAGLRRARGWGELATTSHVANETDEYDRLAEVVRANIRTDLLNRMVGLRAGSYLAGSTTPREARSTGSWSFVATFGSSDPVRSTPTRSIAFFARPTLR